MQHAAKQKWIQSTLRRLVVVGLCLLPCGAFLYAQDEDADLKALDPAVRVKKLEDALGKDFVQGSKNVHDLGSAAKTVAGLKIWESTPANRGVGANADPQIYGVDISSEFDLQEISEPVGIYRYSAFGKPDPFLAPYDQFRQTRVAAMEIPIVSPLQVPLPQLKVAGLWELEDGDRKALILTQQGEGVIAKIGDPIGLSGKIIDISSNGVVSRQYKIRTDGSREFQDMTLAFGEGEKDGSAEKILLEPGKEPVVSGPERPDHVVTSSAPPASERSSEMHTEPSSGLPAVPTPLEAPAQTPAQNTPVDTTNQSTGGSP